MTIWIAPCAFTFTPPAPETGTVWPDCPAPGEPSTPEYRQLRDTLAASASQVLQDAALGVFEYTPPDASTPRHGTLLEVSTSAPCGPPGMTMTMSGGRLLFDAPESFLNHTDVVEAALKSRMTALPWTVDGVTGWVSLQRIEAIYLAPQDGQPGGDVGSGGGEGGGGWG